MKKTLLLLACLCSFEAWTQTFQQSYDTPNNNTHSINACSDGGFIFCTENYFDGIITVVKVDYQQQLQWAKNLTVTNGGGASYATPHVVKEGINNNYYLFGESFNSATLTNEYFLTSLDSDGDVLWSKAYTAMIDTSFGPTYYKNRITQHSNGEYTFFLSVIPGLISVHLNSTGDVLSATIFDGDTIPQTKNPGFDSRLTDDGGFICTGKYGDNILTLRLDNNRQVQWTKTIDDGNYHHAKSAIQTSDGNFLVVGTSGFNFDVGIAMKMDDTGTVLWRKELVASNTVYTFVVHSAKQLPNNEYLLHATHFNGTEEQSLLIKLDENGDVITSKELSIYDPFGDLAISGNGTILVHGKDNNNNINTVGVFGLDMDLSSIDCGADQVTVTSVNHNKPTIETSFITQNNTTINMVPVTITAPNVSITKVDYCSGPLAINEQEAAPHLELFPNPAHGDNITLSFDRPITSAVQINIVDALGKMVQQTQFNQFGTNASLSVAGLSAGIYHVQAYTNNTLITTRKLLIAR